MGNLRHIILCGRLDGAGCDQQWLTGPDAADAVDLLELALAHVVARGEVGQGFVFLHHDGLPAGQGLLVGGQVAFEMVDLLSRDQKLAARLVGQQRAVVARVQLAQVFLGNAGQPGCDIQVHVTAGGDGDKVGLVGQLAHLHAKTAGLAQHVAYRQQLGNILAGFVGQAQVFKVGRQAPGAVALDGAADVAFAPVVGGQCQ